MRKSYPCHSVVKALQDGGPAGWYAPVLGCRLGILHPLTWGAPMKHTTAFLKAAVLPLTVAFVSACGEDTLESTLTDSDRDLLAHTPGWSRHVTPASLVLAPGYAQLDDASARDTPGSLHLRIDAAGEIPRHPDTFIQSVAVFGYAWADLDTGKGVVAVIHPAIGRDSRQNPDGWHTHPVQLTAGTAASGFCIVSIGRSQAGIAIQGDILRTNLSLRWAGLNAGAFDVAAAFIVQVDPGCTASGLGVAVLEAEAI